MQQMIASQATDVATIVEREFPVVRQFTYLDAASRGPWPERTRVAVAQFAAQAQTPCHIAIGLFAGI
jgi:hypothetical protein